MDNDVGAVLDGLLVVGGGKTVVNDEFGVVLMGELGEGAEVGDVEHGVGWAF